MKVRIIAQMKTKPERRALVLDVNNAHDQEVLKDVMSSYLNAEDCVFVRVERLIGGADVYVPDVGGGDVGGPPPAAYV